MKPSGQIHPGQSKSDIEALGTEQSEGTPPSERGSPEGLGARTPKARAPNSHGMVRVRLAEVCQRVADALTALGDIAPPLRSLASLLLGDAASSEGRKSRRARGPIEYAQPVVEYSDVDRARARAGLRRAGLFTGRQP